MRVSDGLEAEVALGASGAIVFVGACVAHGVLGADARSTAVFAFLGLLLLASVLFDLRGDS